MGTGGAFIDTQTLASTGTYKIEMDPSGTSTGNITFTLYDVVDTAGTVTIGGGPVSVPITVPGQNGQFTFSGNSSQQVTISITGNTLGIITVKLLKPDGSQLFTYSSGSSSFTLSTQTLPTTGTYTIVIDPIGAGTGSPSLNVTSP